MPKVSKLIIGLNILLRYEPLGWCDASDGILWGPKGADIYACTDEDMDALREHGWHYDDGRHRWYAHT